MPDRETIVQELLALRWEEGYDRNGSHDAGHYVAYESGLCPAISLDGIYALADYVISKLQN